MIFIETLLELSNSDTILKISIFFTCKFQRKTFGDNANDAKAIILNKSGLAEKESSPSSVRGCLLPVRDDGLVKAELESRIVSREDIIDKTEAEHAIINGDFSDEVLNVIHNNSFLISLARCFANVIT